LKDKFIIIIFLLFCFDLSGQFYDLYPAVGEGWYYEKDGRKIPGLLNLSYGENMFTDKSVGACKLIYRSEEGAKKEKYSTRDICCFVIGKDSFSIIKNFQLDLITGYEQDFAQVLQSGKINLYLYYYTAMQSIGGLYTVATWLIEKEGKIEKLTKSTFKKLMTKYLSDYPELITKINNKILAYDDTEEIIRIFNEKMKK
jgi:hypothetical protein